MIRAVLCLTLVLALTSCAAPGSSAAPSESASGGPTASLPPSAGPLATVGSPRPSVSATPVPESPGTAIGGLTVPGFVLVTAERLLMRRDPGMEGEVITTADNCIDNPDPNCARPLLLGTESGYRWLYLFDGPVEADGYTWYLAATEMNTETHASTYPEAVGWVASGDGADAWLVPDTNRSCPRPPIELADVTNSVLTKLEMVECLGNQELTLRGWYPTLPPDAIEAPVEAERCRAQYGWLACDSIYDILTPVERTWAGDANYLDFVVDPDASVSMPARGQWITVRGSFDHPAADSCGAPGAVLMCRTTFVVTAVEPG